MRENLSISEERDPEIERLREQLAEARANEAAARSEADMAGREVTGILESMSDAFFAVDDEWRFTYVNRRAEEFWSKSRDDLLGKVLWEECPEAIGSLPYHRLRSTMEEGVVTSFEATSPAMGAWVAGRAYPSAKGGISVYFDDITERKQARNALRESEEKYRTLFESIDEGFCVVEVLFDAEGRSVDYRFLETNPTFEKQTGLEQAVGKRMRELAPLHEEHWFEIYGRVALTGEPVRFERGAEALHRWFDVYAYRYGEPERHQVAILFKDVTERRQAEVVLRESEERLRLATEAAEMYAWEIDLTSQTFKWSKGAESLVDFPMPKTLSEILDILHPEDRAEVIQAFERAIEHGGEFKVEYRIADHPPGKEVWLFSAGITIAAADGSPVRVVGVTQNITGRKEAEKERDRLLAREWVTRAEVTERERISRELHDRVAHSMGVAHQSLQLYEVLAKRDASRAAAKLELAKETTKAALESTRNLSADLRRLDAEDDLEAELRHFLEVAVPSDTLTRVSVEGDESIVPGYVRGQLFLVLREAIRNAVVHAGCTSISVGLEIRPGMVKGRVEDDGKGFEADGGSEGVGLRSMRERTALLDGALKLTCEPEQGTRVEIVVPLKG